MDKLKDLVVQRVCETYGFNPLTIFKTGRIAEVVKVRQIIFALLRRLGFRYREVSALSKRDHTTIMSGVRNAERRWSTEIHQFYNELPLCQYDPNLPIPFDPDALNNPISEKRYHYLAHRIERTWIGEGKSILEVAQVLSISLRRFAYVIGKYGIKKEGLREPGQGNVAVITTLVN